MFQTISMRQLETMLDRNGRNRDFLLLGVRPRDEYAGGHLAGAVNIPADELEERIAEISCDRPVVIYCAFGSHSMMAARFLDRCGYRVINTAGGLAYYRGRHFMSC